MSKKQTTSLDRGMMAALFLLMGTGLVQVYSSSFIFAIESRGNGHYFFGKQFLFTFIAIAVLLVTAKFPWRIVERWGFLSWFVASAALFGTFVPGIAHKAGGAARWIKLPGGLRFEPGELLKIAFCILMATFLSRRTEWLGRAEWPLKVGLVSIPLLMLLKQPDFGTFAICLSVGITVLFVYGLRWKYIVMSIMSAAPVLIYLVMSSPYRKARVMAFLDPWSDPEQKGFQVIQSMLSFHSGGIFGAGLGQGQGKLFFLPEAHTDFTLAVFGEELGFVGFVLLLSVYGFLVLRGLQIALRSHNEFNRALATGLTVTFAYSVFINMGVVLGLLPTKGLTLPFLSYGGSSLVVMSLLFGLLLNLESQLHLAPVGKKRKGYKVSRHQTKRKRKGSLRAWK